MGIQYDPSDYEMPWRRNYELMAAAAWFTGSAGYAGYAAFGSFPSGPLLWISGGMTLFGLFKLRKGLRLLRLQHRLAGTPLPLCTFDDLQRICNDPAHRGEIWLGKGFLWGPTHTQRIMDILRRDWQQIVKDALGPFFVCSRRKTRTSSSPIPSRPDISIWSNRSRSTTRGSLGFTAWAEAKRTSFSRFHTPRGIRS